MRRMLREVPNCESTHAEHGRDDHSRGWRTYVAVICDYIMVSPGPSRGQRQHGGREISFVLRRTAPRRVARPSPPVGTERRRRGRFLARRPYVVATPKRPTRPATRRVSRAPTYFVTGAPLDIARRSLDARTNVRRSRVAPRIPGELALGLPARNTRDSRDDMSPRLSAHSDFPPDIQSCTFQISRMYMSRGVAAPPSFFLFLFNATRLRNHAPPSSNSPLFFSFPSWFIMFINDRCCFPRTSELA